jgi:hypothetical protein
VCVYTYLSKFYTHTHAHTHTYTHSHVKKGIRGVITAREFLQDVYLMVAINVLKKI